MNKENIIAAKTEQPNVRITRAQSKALGISGGLPLQNPPSKQDQKKAVQPKLKRAASDENRPTARPQLKKQTVLEDITNNSNARCINDCRVLPTRQAKSGVMRRNTKETKLQEDTKANIAEVTTKERKQDSQETNTLVVRCEEPLKVQPTSIEGCKVADLMPVKQTGSIYSQSGSSSQEDEDQLWKKLVVVDGLHITDIDSNHRDHQMCSVYAPDIYRNQSAMELNRRPSVDYMEMLQRDITGSMRGILVDWLIEVADEYVLVPDTLYMTVNLIDRFLSKKYIDRKRLQLLGITCMLIASKYEEICAPRVEEFCFITDNTYKRDEVLEMESQVLNSLGFQLSVPTTKRFLRRFVHAAQSSYEDPRVELEFLANYLAELTLTEYSLLKFLPSLIAASAVFLARWTLDQSDHPWNPTLEYYTSYQVSDLKDMVFGLQDLQLNTNRSSLNTIREKYRQQKFKCVTTLSSPKPVQSLF